MIKMADIDDNTSMYSNYYTLRLKLTGDIEPDVEILYDLYKDRIGECGDSRRTKEVIHEYYVAFSQRGIPAAEILANKIAYVGRKEGTKKTIGYLVACLRNVLENGICSTNSNVENRMIKAFENKFCLYLSPDGKDRLLSIAAQNSTVEVLFSLLENTVDLESVLLDTLENVVKKD
jgi:hypothetical protein